MKLNRTVKKTLAAYLIIYAVICFTRWEIYNPYTTLKYLPTLSYGERFCALIGYAFCTLFLHVSLYLYDPKNLQN